jgi:hypothetical protein
MATPGVVWAGAVRIVQEEYRGEWKLGRRWKGRNQPVLGAGAQRVDVLAVPGRDRMPGTQQSRRLGGTFRRVVMRSIMAIGFL